MRVEDYFNFCFSKISAMNNQPTIHDVPSVEFVDRKLESRKHRKNSAKSKN